MPAPSEEQSAPQVPQGYWETRWDAIAIGSTATGGGVGVSKDMINKRKAEKAAMLQCKATGGGKSCRIARSYYNQCAVIAWGEHWLRDRWGRNHRTRF